MKYIDYKNEKQKEFNELPIFWAFSDSQLEEAMKERGLTIEDTDKIYQFGLGGFYLKSDSDKIKNYFINKEDKLEELMKNPEFAEDAFYYEMENHEYFINWQADWDVCSCFGNPVFDEEKDYVDYLKELGYSDEIIVAYKKAKSKLYKYWDENDMF